MRKADIAALIATYATRVDRSIKNTKSYVIAGTNQLKNISLFMQIKLLRLFGLWCVRFICNCAID